MLFILGMNASPFSQELIPITKGDTIFYELEITEKLLDYTGNPVQALAINGSVPGPVLRFQKGKYAAIRVKNKLTQETSVHWHGLLLPNYMDGVPYLTTPPIRPGESLTYHFPLIQSGTYWYHSHTGLQEQRGVYGSIIIEPETPDMEYDHDLVLILADWSEEKPERILKNLKRHNEWYGVKTGSAPSLLKAIQTGTLGAQLRLWKDKMPGMHISDIPYNAFLVNGAQEVEYTQFKPGETIRLRVINAAASTYFWLQLGKQHLQMVSADGMNIRPVHFDKVLIGNAETYDFLVTIPEGKSLEFRATAQDVTGYASAWLGAGTKVKAPDLPKPDYAMLNEKMANMHGSGNQHMEPTMHIGTPTTSQHTGHQHMSDASASPSTSWDVGYTISSIKAAEKNNFHHADSIRHLTFNLTGNMWRYVWSFNGKTLSASNKIAIKKGEVVRITLNNTTMMHHPMHLHGHFFRVLNGQGDYAPLKHTVDVPPMSSVTIEFAADNEKDWFFHCHILYHMMSGMSRIFSYEESNRDPRLAPYPVATLYKHDKQWFTWATLAGASHFGELKLTHSNTYGEFNFMAEAGWNNKYEIKLDYERFKGNYFRIYTGFVTEQIHGNNGDRPDLKARAGIRYLLWYILDTDISLDHSLNPQLGLDAHLPLTQRLIMNNHAEWKLTTNLLESEKTSLNSEFTFSTGVEFLLNQSLSVMAGYDNRFGAGAGFYWRF